MLFEKQGVIERYPSYINEVSVQLGKWRTFLNKKTRAVNAKYERGEQGEAVDILGIKGELIVQHFLFEKKIPYRSSPLIAETPIAEPDIIIGEKLKIDVKGVFQEKTVLAVNDEAHKKKEVTHYWFVQPMLNGSCNYWIFTYEEVSKWNFGFLGFTNGYSLEIRETALGLNQSQKFLSENPLLDILLRG